MTNEEPSNLPPTLPPTPLPPPGKRMENAVTVAFAVSGALGIAIWPILLLGSIFLFDAPRVSPGVEILRRAAFFSLLLPPPVWIASLVLALQELKGKKRRKHLWAYAIAPYAAACTHGLILAVLFSLPK